MNAFTAPANLTDTCELIGRSFQHTDTLFLDLYGSLPDEDEEHYIVEHVYVAGTTVRTEANDLVELFTGKQLRAMGEYLTFKDDTNPTLRRHAADKKYEAVQGPFERR